MPHLELWNLAVTLNISIPPSISLPTLKEEVRFGKTRTDTMPKGIEPDQALPYRSSLIWKNAPSRYIKLKRCHFTVNQRQTNVKATLFQSRVPTWEIVRQCM